MTTNNQPLFRIEPTFAGRRRECAAFARSPSTQAFLVYGICLVIVAGAVFASKQHLARKTTITGRVELAGGELKLYADTRRIVSSILVRDGELVREGQALAVLRRPDHNSTSTFSVDHSERGYESLLASFRREKTRLTESKSDARRETDTNRRNLNKRRQTLKATLKNQAFEKQTLNKLQQLSAEQLERGRELHHSGHLSLAQLEELQHRHSENKLKFSASKRATLDLKDRLQSTEHQIKLLDLKLQERLRSIDQANGRNSRELTQLKMNLELNLTAPADGIITGLLSHIGATVEPNLPIITMVKNGAKFRARLWATSNAAGELKNGQEVNLMLDAFPHQKHGMLHGKVAHINESPLTLRELDAPWERAGPTYSIAVAIDNSSSLYPQLKPGMNLTADIKLDESLLVERLFEPVIQAWQRTL